jgi:hypothetical protein
MEEITDRLNKHYGWKALQRRQVLCWIKELKGSFKHLNAGKGVQRGSSSFKKKNCRGFEHLRYDNAKLFSQVFGDEMRPYAIGFSDVEGGAQGQTEGDGRSHATNAEKP